MYLGALKKQIDQDPEIQKKVREQTERILGQEFPVDDLNNKN